MKIEDAVDFDSVLIAWCEVCRVRGANFERRGPDAIEEVEAHVRTEHAAEIER